MSDWNLPWEGACRCGRVKLKVSAPPLLTMACHCIGCQRMTASAFSLSVMVAAAGFEVTAGEPVIGGLHGDDVHHYFCPHCMSWLYTRPQAADWLVNVRSTMLDGAPGSEPFMETYTSEKLAWVTTPAQRSYPKFPEFDEYASLTQAFAEYHAKSAT
ncbi:MAG: GFA family protein [Phenylobacterium sp.]|uniref:GFA family protein n=1 Tax=Phenylobacterium sp. TaxID=1871053 RepID=UPI001A1DA030|nr:GFA family protein [Phenylobacterium sp.]MBJ7412967.1 GFA family protein [Phenylobacterium sp.]